MLECPNWNKHSRIIITFDELVGSVLINITENKIQGLLRGRLVETVQTPVPGYQVHSAISIDISNLNGIP